MAETKIVFGIKNLKYAKRTDISAAGVPTYGDITSLPSASEVTFQPNVTKTDVYADDEVITQTTVEKPWSGSFSVLNVDDAFEESAGLEEALSGGIASVEQKGAPAKFAFYFESEGQDDSGDRVTLKTWLFGVSVSHTKADHKTTEGSASAETYSYDMSIYGEKKLISGGTAIYTDSNGNSYNVWKMTAKPGATNYDSFGASVPSCAEAS